MSFVNNLVATSLGASSKVNEFNFTCQYASSIILPKAVSLSRAVINNTMLTFRPSQLSIFLVVDGSGPMEIKLVNGYYDTIAEFITMLNNLQGLSALGITFSFSQLTESLKITKSINTNVPFSVKAFYFNSSSNVCKRLGFNINQDYTSYLEGANQVIYASSPVKLLRTTGFFLTSNLTTVDTASPGGNINIVDFIPIEVQNLQYGDVIAISNAAISKNVPVIDYDTQRNMHHNSQFTFQLLDDEMEMITDSDKGLNTILFLNFSYE